MRGGTGRAALVLAVALASPAHAADGWRTDAGAVALAAGWVKRCGHVEPFDSFRDLGSGHPVARREGPRLSLRATSQGAGRGGSYTRTVARVDLGRCAGQGYEESGDNHEPFALIEPFGVEAPPPSTDQLVDWLSHDRGHRYDIHAPWQRLRLGAAQGPADAAARLILRGLARGPAPPGHPEAGWTFVDRPSEPEEPGPPRGAPAVLWPREVQEALALPATERDADGRALVAVEAIGKPALLWEDAGQRLYRTPDGGLVAVYDRARDRHRWVLAVPHYSGIGLVAVRGGYAYLDYEDEDFDRRLIVVQLASGRGRTLISDQPHKGYRATATGLFVVRRDETSIVIPYAAIEGAPRP